MDLQITRTHTILTELKSTLTHKPAALDSLIQKTSEAVLNHSSPQASQQISAQLFKIREAEISTHGGWKEGAAKILKLFLAGFLMVSIAAICAFTGGTAALALGGLVLAGIANSDMTVPLIKLIKEERTFKADMEKIRQAGNAISNLADDKRGLVATTAKFTRSSAQTVGELQDKDRAGAKGATIDGVDIPYSIHRDILRAGRIDIQIAGQGSALLEQTNASQGAQKVEHFYENLLSKLTEFEGDKESAAAIFGNALALHPQGMWKEEATEALLEKMKEGQPYSITNVTTRDLEPHLNNAHPVEYVMQINKESCKHFAIGLFKQIDVQNNATKYRVFTLERQIPTSILRKDPFTLTPDDIEKIEVFSTHSKEFNSQEEALKYMHQARNQFQITGNFYNF